MRAVSSAAALTVLLYLISFFPWHSCLGIAPFINWCFLVNDISNPLKASTIPQKPKFASKALLQWFPVLMCLWYSITQMGIGYNDLQGCGLSLITQELMYQKLVQCKLPDLCTYYRHCLPCSLSQCSYAPSWQHSRSTGLVYSSWLSVV